MVLKKTSGPTRQDVKRGWRILRNEWHDLYSVPNTSIFRAISDELGGAYFTHGGEWKLVLCFDVKALGKIKEESL
jgi:hypothetical protein